MHESVGQERKHTLNTLKVLYVEDDMEAMQELSYFLKKRVASLSTAHNGVEALRIFENQSFDVIICDLWMPEMDGLEFVKTIRQSGDDTPIIITSAFSDIETILKAVDLGIVKYCVKPIEIEELLSCLEKIAIENLENAGRLIDENDLIVNREQRLEMEKKLKSGFARVLKSLTGKGPKQVHVSLGVNELEIWSTDVHTPIEKSLLNTKSHAGIVQYLRKAIYSSYKETYEDMVKNVLGKEVALVEVRNEIAENTDWLVFKIE